MRGSEVPAYMIFLSDARDTMMDPVLEEHLPVLYEEVLDGLNPRPGGRYIDATAGRGGHSEGLLQRSAPDGRVLAIDADPSAVQAVQARLTPYGERATVIQANFRNLAAVAQSMGWDQVDGVLLDLGLSSPQLATAHRGFSFDLNGPLDMRFDPTAGITAADLVNDLDEVALADLFWRYGEDRAARRVARAIVAARRDKRLTSTTELADLIERVVGRHGRLHPATRFFQALRIAVNEELDALVSVLPQAVGLLRPAGRLAVIAFHSLEDRVVKRYLQQEMKRCVCPPAQPVCTCTHHPTLRAVSKGAIQAGAGEVLRNRRARSARLRVAERL
jgi:16S rRNA (cytosine1402-N4)-methyltransferase